MIKQSQRPKSSNSLDGFSLTEVVIATAIIGTISSIAYPTYIDVKDTAKAKKYRSNDYSNTNNNQRLH